MLVSPDNFGLVEVGVYRCSKIDSDNFPFLKTLQLKSLIMLDAEKPPRLLSSFLESNNIELFNLGGLKISSHHSKKPNKGEKGETHQDKAEELIDVVNLGDLRKNSKTEQWMLIERNLTSRTFELLLDAKKHNILLIDSTSTLVGILRKIQKWNFNSILNEYRTFSASNKNNYYAETFLELIQVELVPFEVDQLNHRLKEKQQLKEQQSLKDQMKYLKEQQRYLEFSRLGSSVDGAIDESDLGRCSDDEDVDEDDDSYGDLTDDDDDMLSASPQIPANLLKLVEQRKKNEEQSDTTPGTSPRVSTNGLLGHSGRKSRHNSIGGGNEIFLHARAGMDRRRSSTDVKRGIAGSLATGSPSSITAADGAIPLGGNHFRNRRASMESSPPVFRKIKERELSLHQQQIQSHLSLLQSQSMQVSPQPSLAEINGSLQSSSSSPSLSQLSAQQQSQLSNAEALEAERIHSRYDYKYYKNLNKYEVNYENVNVIKFKLPAEDRLPSWFTNGRDFWEENMRKLNEA